MSGSTTRIKQMRALTMAIVVSLGITAPTALIANQEALSCETYRTNQDRSRDRIVGSYLWVWLKRDAERVTPNQAGSLIVMVPTMRAIVDAECATAGGDITPIVAKVMRPFYTAAMSDREIR